MNGPGNAKTTDQYIKKKNERNKKKGTHLVKPSVTLWQATETDAKALITAHLWNMASGAWFQLVVVVIDPMYSGTK